MDNWKKLSEKLIDVGFIKVLKKTFELPDGKSKEFDIKRDGRVVCVLALTVDNKVLLAKQYRPGPEKVLLELIGGGVGKDKTPEEAIKRELLEETGYTGNIEFVGTSYHSAYSTMQKYSYIATDCHKIQEQQLDDSEFIEVIEMSLLDFRKHLRSGELTDVECGYLCLEYLESKNK